jgi:hypothetical protein
MTLTMVKKRLADGSECRKCVEATDHLKSRGLWDRVDEIVWAEEGDPASPGMVLGATHSVAMAPFFIVTDERGYAVFTSVLQLVRERLGQSVTIAEQAAAIDADDIGGI